jgi:hypothetical protein
VPCGRRPHRRGDASPKPTDDHRGRSDPKPRRANRRGPRDAWPAHVDQPDGRGIPRIRLPAGSPRSARNGAGRVEWYRECLAPTMWNCTWSWYTVPCAQRHTVGAMHRRNRRTIIVSNRTRNLGTPADANLAMRRPHAHINGRARHSENQATNRKPAQCTKQGWSNQVARGMPGPYNVESHPVPVGRARHPPVSQPVGATHRRNR